MKNIIDLVVEGTIQYADYIVILWYIGVVISCIFIYFKYDKEHKRVFNDPIYKELPAQYSPAILSYFLTGKVGANSYCAAILDLIRKDLLVVLVESNKSYLVIGSGAESTKQELMLRNFLISKIGNGERVTIDEIRKTVNGYKTGPYFKNSYDYWRDSVLFNSNMYKFYHKYKRATGVILYSVVGLLLWVLYMMRIEINFNNMSLIDLSMTFIPVISITLVAYLFKAKRRTGDTNEIYYKWGAFSNYLKSFTISNKEVNPALIDSYFVYSLILGSDNKLRDDVLYNKKIYASIDDKLKIKPDVFLSMNKLCRDIRKSVGRNKGRSVVNSTIKSSAPAETLGQNDLGDRGIGF